MYQRAVLANCSLVKGVSDTGSPAGAALTVEPCRGASRRQADMAASRGVRDTHAEIVIRGVRSGNSELMF